jgi:hypothetical protein
MRAHRSGAVDDEQQQVADAPFADFLADVAGRNEYRQLAGGGGEAAKPLVRRGGAQRGVERQILAFRAS